MKAISSKSFRKKLGKRIRELRKEHKLSQDQLAYNCGISREEVYRIELGYQNVSIDILHVIAKELDVHIKEFFEFEY